MKHSFIDGRPYIESSPQTCSFRLGTVKKILRDLYGDSSP